MPDEMSMSEDAEEIEAIPPIVHDDIMQRLLDYQRQLREGLTPEQAAEPAASPILVDYAALESPAHIATQTDTVEVIDLAAIEAAIEESIDADTEPAPADAVPQIWATSSNASGDLAARLAKLEDTLSGVAESVSDLRAQFQNMAIAADDRLAAIESMISSAKDDAADAS